jgi:hypothetical protein
MPGRPMDSRRATETSSRHTSEKTVGVAREQHAMKRVVMIAYFFPPEGSAGSYRPLRFVRHLASVGWSPIVIAAHPYQYERYDAALLEAIPHDTEVIRVRERDPWHAIQAWRAGRLTDRLSAARPEGAERMRAALRRPLRSRLRQAVRVMEACYYRPDLARPWIAPAIEATLKVCRRSRPNVLWATAGPVSSWIVAREVSKRTGIPYVLDLRDPWGLSYHESEFRTPQWVKRQMRRTMHGLFNEAQSVVLLFDSVARAYSHLLPNALDPSRIHIIPNGYEGPIEECALPESSRCHVLYAGTTVGYRYDTLFEALSLLKTRDSSRAQKLRFQFVGEGADELRRAAAEMGISDLVQAEGPALHSEIMRYQQSASALLVLGRPATINGYELFAPAKVFGYLKAMRPIVGVLAADETRKVLARVGVSLIADVDSPVAICSVLQELVDGWSCGSLAPFLPDRQKCEVYSAERQTEALVRALEGAPPSQPFVPDAAQLPASLREASFATE